MGFEEHNSEFNNDRPVEDTGIISPAPQHETPSPAPAPWRREFVTLAVIAVISLASAFFLKLCVAQAYEIRGASMEPTLLDGDRVILLKLAPDYFPIHKNDMIIFTHPSDPERNLIKRVIGLPHDEIKLSHGKVYVNDICQGIFSNTLSHQRKSSWKIPENFYFVLGDNRSNSLDSRDFGPIEKESIKGKVLFRWWPLDQRKNVID